MEDCRFRAQGNLYNAVQLPGLQRDLGDTDKCDRNDRGKQFDRRLSFGMFIIGAAVGAAIVYGTGYYHPRYVYWGPGVPYPIYRPWPCTYGVGAVYNP